MKNKLIIAGIAALMNIPIASGKPYSEKLDRGAVLMMASRTPYISWRSFTTDSEDMYFDAYRPEHI